MSNRKLWKVQYPGGHAYVRPESLASVYRWIDAERANFACRGKNHQADSQYVDVLVDERDGKGFRFYETVDLAQVTP